MNTKKSELDIDLNLLKQGNTVDCASEDEWEQYLEDFDHLDKENPIERTRNYFENILSAYIYTNPGIQPNSESPYVIISHAETTSSWTFLYLEKYTWVVHCLEIYL
jgi:hypothetical protein